MQFPTCVYWPLNQTFSFMENDAIIACLKYTGIYEAKPITIVYWGPNGAINFVPSVLETFKEN